jgi:hypothetical protein
MCLPSTLGIWLRLYLSEVLAVTDCGEGRHLHDCSLATDRTTPSKRQWGSRRRAMAMGLYERSLLGFLAPPVILRAPPVNLKLYFKLYFKPIYFKTLFDFPTTKCRCRAVASSISHQLPPILRHVIAVADD